MNFKRNILLSMMTFSFLTVIQPAFSQGMMMATPEERANRLKERLSLTEDQTKKVQEIFKNADKERQEKMQGSMGDRDAMRQLMTELAAKTDKEIEKLLSNDQKKKYEELKKERRQMRRGPGMDREPRNRERARPDSATTQ